MAKYPHIVNKNGIWYPSGTEVPDDENIEKETKKRKAEIKSKSAANLQKKQNKEVI